MASILDDLRASFRPVDALDILLVAVFVYASVVAVRRARSRFVLAGLAALAVLYLLARTLELHVTLSIFQAAVTVALVALVVVFQEDIRRAFERLATTRGPLRKKAAPEWESAVDVVAETVPVLAGGRVGALIVFRGREPLDRHLTGGFALEGRVSAPLLHSIFDASSPGHDGAVVIEAGAVSRFGVHLPLSTSESRAGALGTRHTAALGLAGCSDALVLVVSEERGEVSVAIDGRLRVIPSSEVRAVLTEFLDRVAPLDPVAGWRRALSRDLRAKALSVAVALVAWLAVVGQERQVQERGFEVPIAIGNAPDSLLLEEPRPATARVTLSGPSRAFERLDAASLVIDLDAGELSGGASRLAIRNSDLTVPGELSVERVEPRLVTVTAHETVVRAAPVRVETTGRLPDGLRLVRTTVEPPRVSLVVRRADAARLGPVRTEPVDLGAIEATTRISARLALPRDAYLAPGATAEGLVTVEVAPTARPPVPASAATPP